MQRLRLKADGRIVELRDGQEFPLAPVMASAAPATASVAPAEVALPAVRELRRRARLTQLEFASRLGVPVETIRIGAGQTDAARTGAGAARRDCPCPRDGVCRTRDQRIALLKGDALAMLAARSPEDIMGLICLSIRDAIR